MNFSSKSTDDSIRFFTFDPKLSSLGCDHHHHFYHYQASAQYLWLAEALRALKLPEEAVLAYDKAIFQDHLNEEAIERKKSIALESGAYTPLYASHPLFDFAFCESIGKEPSKATYLHDEGVNALLTGDSTKALSCFDKAIEAEPAHSNGYFARGKYWFEEKEYEKARADFEEAIRLSHLAHEAYHRTASGEHLTRALKFLEESEFDLAITDCTKALDLCRSNNEALKTRAAAYRAKGSMKLAEEDEEALRLLS